MSQPETVVTELTPEIRMALESRVASAEPGMAFLLPARIEGTTGLYRESQYAIPKELRAAGVSVDFLHPSEQRRALGEFSEELVVGFALGVAQNMTWDTAKLVWQYIRARVQFVSKPDCPARVSIEVARVSIDGCVIEGLRITGIAEDDTATAVIRALTGEATDQQPE